MKIVVDDKIPFLDGVFEHAGCSVVSLPGAKIDRKTVADADALIVRTRTHCDAALLQGSHVKFIATATIGFDHLDIPWLEGAGIGWTNAPGCNAQSVADYLASALINLEHAGKFRLKDSVLGVVGVGQVGSRVTKVAKALGMRVLQNDPPREAAGSGGPYCSLEAICREADIVTFHVPRIREGRYQTENLCGRSFLEALRPGAWLINTSRGEVIDEAALKAALIGKRIGGAILDVWRDEPEIDLELLGLLFCGTSHIGGYSADGKANGSAQVVNAVSRRFGLGLDDWYPAEIPAPSQPTITLTSDEPVYHAITHAYDIFRDGNALLRSPSHFEEYRGNYPLRREFCAFTVHNAGAHGALLQQLGFQVDV